MTPELQKYYESRLSMMSTQSWVDLMEDIEVMLKSTDTLSGIADAKALHVRQGEVSMMRWMLSLADTSEKAYEQLKDEDADNS